MSASEEQASGPTEQACVLCGRADTDSEICGTKLENDGLCAHVCCLLSASDLLQHALSDQEGLAFDADDIQDAVEQAAQKVCVVCGKTGAAITCCVRGCDCSFHLPCARSGECITQFFGVYMSFCSVHCPRQTVEAAQEEETSCLICMERVDNGLSFHTMVCPACKHAWFHRDCIQRLASSAGILSFQCPLCRDEDLFFTEMLHLGIKIPIRLPAQQTDQAYAVLTPRHRCDADVCLCPGGREQAEEEGPWQLLWCSSCAGQGAHRGCSSSGSSTTCWECDCCAELGTASSASLEVAGLSSASQPGSGPSRSSPAPESSGSSTSHCVASGSSCGPPAPQSSTSSQEASGQCHDSQAPETSSPNTGSQEASVQGFESLAQETSSPSTTRTEESGPSCSQRGRHCESSHVPELSAQSSSPSQEVLAPSHSSPAHEISSPGTGSQAAPGGPSCSSPPLEGTSRCSSPGPRRVQSGTRSNRQAQKPNSQPGRRHKRSRVPEPKAGSSSSTEEVLDSSDGEPALKTRRCREPSGQVLGAPARSSSGNISQAPAGPSCSSLSPEGTSRCSSPGPRRVRSGTCSNRQPQKPNSRPGRRHKRSRLPEPSAGSSSSTEEVLELSDGEPARKTRRYREPSGQALGAPAQSSSGNISPFGPERVQGSTRSNRQAQKTNSRARRLQKRSRVPEPNAGSSSSTEEVLEPSDSEPARKIRRRQEPSGQALGAPARRSSGNISQAPAGPSGSSPSPEGTSPPRPKRVRRCRAPTPCSRPGRRRENSRVPPPSAETSSPSTGSLLPSRSSRNSRAPESRRRSSPVGPVNQRDRSRSPHRAQEADTRRGRHRRR